MLFKKITKRLTSGSTTKTIEAIHNEFNSASDVALQEARKIIDHADQGSIAKAERLKKIGFVSSEDVARTESVMRKQNEYKNLSETVCDYATRYPNNKFITEQQVKSICEKYKLVCGEIKYFKGFVPDKKLKEIEAFEVKPEDVTREISRDEQMRYRFELQIRHNPLAGLGGGRERPKAPRETPAGLKICAPTKDFDLNGMEIIGHKLSEKPIPDPVVLQPVKGGYLIVTAWGDEASDEMVVNEKNN